MVPSPPIAYIFNKKETFGSDQFSLYILDNEAQALAKALKTHVRTIGKQLTAMSKALFSCENFLDFATVVFSFVFDKYCSIMY